ncbi:MAG: LPXTG cell wall anchor domain-containing protein [Bacteroidetes bacterium]|nr:LPXTG cell wall anchor domain-containing protein [Bacteroidota bacterium]
MKRKLQYIISCWLLLLLSFVSFSQDITVRASIDRNKILIGEPIRLNLEANVPNGTEAGWFPLDSLSHFEFIEKGKIDTAATANGRTFKQTVTITSFDSGRWVVPSLPMQSGNKAYLTDSLPVSVAFSNFNPQQDYHDIKDILDVPNPNTGYINWVIAGLVLLSAAGLVYFLRKKAARPVQAVAVARPISKLSPLQEAMQSLDELAGQAMSANGEAKAFYTKLNDILRWYLYRRAGLQTMEKTSSELLMQLRQYNLPSDAMGRLSQALRTGDAVKFAKYQPAGAENKDTLDTLRQSIGELDKIIS